MPDWIRFVQWLMRRATGERDLFAITQISYNEHGFYDGELRARQMRLGSRWGVRLFSHAYRGVIGRVHVHDAMLQNDSAGEIEHYIRVGHDAIRNIEESLAAAGRSLEDVRYCLDMASGSGRVLRLLQTRIPAERISACDIDEEAVKFLAAEFGVQPIVSSKNLHEVRFPHKYDLIWVGSLFSHLQPKVAFDLLEQMFDLLEPAGVLVFTAQGKECIKLLANYGHVFVPLEAPMRRSLEQEGYAFAPYFMEQDPDYGITLFRNDWFEAFMNTRFAGKVRQVRFAERGWDNHQDVYAFERLKDSNS